MSDNGNASVDVASLVDRFTAVPPATRSGGIPATGWSRIALVLQGLHGEADALVLIELDDGGSIVIDWGRKDYWWRGGADFFPKDPSVLNVRLYRGAGARLPFMQEQPGELASLLWIIGLYSFANQPAWWFNVGSRQRLVRWPDFTTLEHDADQVKMTALLASKPLNADELARTAGTTTEEAQRLINTLGLMGLLTEVFIDAPVVEENRLGLFSRLRARLAG
jgi:hypothetical protein